MYIYIYSFIYVVVTHAARSISPDAKRPRLDGGRLLRGPCSVFGLSCSCISACLVRVLSHCLSAERIA